MIRSLKETRGTAIHATDGFIGSVHDLYFDDQSWRIRYLVADTGKWLPGRKVLISPEAFSHPNWRDFISLNLTREQIRNSPDMNTDLPVSRRQEQQLVAHYGWTTEWLAPVPEPGALSGISYEPLPAEAREPEHPHDPNLRSAHEVISYTVQATDANIGHIDDFLFDDDAMLLRYAAVDTRDWLPSRSVLIPVRWMRGIHWAESRVLVDVDRHAVKTSPKFEPSMLPLDARYEKELLRHYDRPVVEKSR